MRRISDMRLYSTNLYSINSQLFRSFFFDQRSLLKSKFLRGIRLLSSIITIEKRSSEGNYEIVRKAKSHRLGNIDKYVMEMIRTLKLNYDLVSVSSIYPSTPEMFFDTVRCFEATMSDSEDSSSPKDTHTDSSKYIDFQKTQTRVRSEIERIDSTPQKIGRFAERFNIIQSLDHIRLMSHTGSILTIIPEYERERSILFGQRRKICFYAHIYSNITPVRPIEHKTIQVNFSIEKFISSYYGPITVVLNFADMTTPEFSTEGTSLSLGKHTAQIKSLDANFPIELFNTLTSLRGYTSVKEHSSRQIVLSPAVYKQVPEYKIVGYRQTSSMRIDPASTSSWEHSMTTPCRTGGVYVGEAPQSYRVYKQTGDTISKLITPAVTRMESTSVDRVIDIPLSNGSIESIKRQAFLTGKLSIIIFPKGLIVV